MPLYQFLCTKVAILERRIKEKSVLSQTPSPWYLTEDKKEKLSLPWFLRFSPDFPDQLKLRFYKALLTLARIWMIIKGAPSSNFYVFTQAGKDGVYICNYSYCHYKSFHKSAKYRSLATVVAATVIVSLIVALVFPGKPISKAATINWIQSSWAGGPSALKANDADHRTGWTYYSDADSNITAGATVALTSITGAPITETSDTEFNGKSVTDTTDAHFNAGSPFPTHSSTAVSGSGTSADVKLTKTAPSCDWTTASGIGGADHGGADWTVTDNDPNGYDLNPAVGTIEIAGDHCNVGAFSIPGTVTIKAFDGNNYGRLKVVASSVDISGTLNGNQKGQFGGNYGAGGAMDWPGSNGSVGVYTGSYGGAGGDGGAGGGGGECGVQGGNGGTSAGSIRGNTDGLDIAMGGGGAGGGGGGGAYSSYCGGPPGSNGASGGKGGGSIYLHSSGNTTISGTVSANGGNGGAGGDGAAGIGGDGGGGGSGASGGGVLINALGSLTISGSLNANGGSGGLGGFNYSGARAGSGNLGGSGRIKVFYGSTITNTNANYSATGFGTSSYACAGLTSSASCVVGSIYGAQTTYPSSGIFTSQVFNLGANQNFGKLTWSATTPGNSSITMRVRSGNLNPPTDGTWTTVTNGGSLYAFNGKQYIQYEATLNSTTDNFQTPTLSDVTIYYESTWSNAVVNAGDVKLAIIDRPSAPADSGTDNGGADLTPADGSTISGNYYNVGTFTITSGYTVYVPSGQVLQIKANTINIDGTLNGDARGYAGGTPGGPAGNPGGSGNSGTNTGSYGTSGGGGGGSVWGDDGWCAAVQSGSGGSSVGSVRGFSGALGETDIDMGGGSASGGGGGGDDMCSGAGGPGSVGNPGGGAVYLYASGTATVNGIISVNGGIGGSGGNSTPSYNAYGGGGAGASGGGILINGSSVTVSGTLRANGGSGGSGGNSGKLGGSGRIKLFANSTPTTTNATITALGYHATNPNNGYSGCNVGSIYCAQSAYVSSGAFTSQIINTGQANASWGNAEWSASTAIPANTGITLKARSCDDAACVGETDFSGIAQSIAMTNGAGSSALSSMVVGHRWVQYQATLTSADGVNTPTFADLTINYNYYSTSQTLTSSAYDTTDGGVAINQISWSGSGTSGTEKIRFQIRTSPDSSGSPNWSGGSGWCGPATCAATTGDSDYASDWYETTPAGENINDKQNAANSDVISDRWVQYKVWLTSNSSATPTLTSATIQYVSNSSPKFCKQDIAGTPPDCPGGQTATLVAIQQNSGSSIGKITLASDYPSASSPSYPIADYEESTGLDKDLDGKVSIQYFYNDFKDASSLGLRLNNGGPVGTGALSFTVADPNGMLPATGTIMVDNHLADAANTLSASERIEVISYTSKSGTNPSITLSGLTRQTWPVEAGDTVVYNTQKTTHADNSRIWLMASSATVKGEVSGVSATPKTISTSSLTLNPSSDFASGVFLNNAARIRIAMNDGNAANQVGVIDSGTFTIDVKSPVPSGQAVTIDSTISSPSANLALSVTDDSTLYMRFANASNQTAPDCSADLYSQPDSGSTAYQSYASTYAHYPLSPNADGLSAVCYEFKDAYSNKLQSYASTPATPANLQLADVSYAPTTISMWRNLVWWDAQSGVNYKIYRDSGSGFTLLDTITNASINYCFDEGDGDCANSENGLLDNATTYTYKVLATDADGISSYSSTVSGIPNGSTIGEAPDLTAPALASGPSPNGTGSGSADSATITWTTSGANASSYSIVNYGKNSTTLGSMAGNASESVTSHSVSLSNLDAGATYYYQIISAASPSNQLKSPASPPSGIYSFTTSAPSVVEASPSYIAGTSSAAIYWTTSGTAGSQIRYIASPGDPSGGTSTTLHSPKTTIHYAAIESGLTSSTTYNYQIVLKDGDSNNVVYPAAPGTYYQFTTPASKADETPPSIVDTTSASQSATSASVTWTTTGDSSYSIVEYGPTSGLGYVAGSVATADFTENHTVNLSNLMPGTTYYYKIRSADGSGNLATSPASGTSTFATAALSISAGPSASSSRSSAVITWTTNGISDSRVEYGTDSALAGSSFTSWQDTANKLTDHIVSLGSLSPDTTYYYRAISRNGDGASVTSSILSFETTSGARPAITPGSATPTDTTSDIVFSATSNNSTPVFLSVEYAPSATPPSSFTKESATPSAVTSGASGTVTLEGLASNTTYYYKLKARDAFGNIQTSTSASYNFTTTIDSVAPYPVSDLAAPALSITSTSVTLTWTSPGDNDDIGTASSYDIRYSTVSAADISDNWAAATQVSNEPLPMPSGTSQSITITGLDPFTVYYFAIKTSDEIPNISAISNVATATTLPQADVEAPSITGTAVVGTPTATTATVAWTTSNKLSSSLVDFGRAIDSSYNKTQGNPSPQFNSHSITLIGLDPDTDYVFQTKSIDALGNTGVDDNSGLGYSFRTAIVSSGTTPVITGVTIPTEAAGTLTATSAVITWETAGVLSNSTVGYSMDPAKTYSMETGSTDAVTGHSVTLTGLTPSKKYYFRVRSRNGDQEAIASSDAGGDFNFTTLSGADPFSPIISNVQVTTITANTATITWTTDEDSTSYVDFGTVSGVYTSTMGNPNDSTISHTVQLTSLTPETTYYFRVRSADEAGNSSVLTGTSFTTTSGSAVDCPSRAGASCQACETCPVSDITAPKIENISIAKISFNTATITWTTDEDATSLVSYDTVSFGIKQGYDYSSGNIDEYKKQHSVTLSNLDSATTYYFRASSADAKGNTAKSATQSFKTIAIIEAKDKGDAVAIDLKKEFEEIAKTLVKDNLATEENIKEIISRISNPPLIGSEGPEVRDIKSYGATVYWKTDRKSNSVVKFRPVLGGTEVVGVGNNWQEISRMDNFDTVHQVPLLGLAPSTTYSFYVQSQDILGGIAKSEAQTFTTQAASSIFNVAITDLGLNQATINWETSNISSTSVEWGLSSSYGNYKDKGDEKVKNHSIVLDNLSSGTSYHYRVRSVESSGTILASDDYAFTTYELPQITKYNLGEVTDTSISLSWLSNIPIDSNVRYTNRETGETKIQGKEDRSLDHTFVIDSLEAGKSYRIEIQGRDEKGNLAEAPAFEVQTGMDTAPPEITQVRSQSAIMGGVEDKVQAIISWRTNELSDTKVLWDLGATKGDKFANETKLDSNLTTNHISVITQFKPGTVYRFRVVSADKFGNISVSPDYTILTPVRRQSIIQMIVNQFEGIFGWMKRLSR